MRYFPLQIALLTLAGLPGSLVAAADPGFGLHVGAGASLLRDRDDNDTFEGRGYAVTYGAEYRFAGGISLGVDGFSLGNATDFSTAPIPSCRFAALNCLPVMRSTSAPVWSSMAVLVQPRILPTSIRVAAISSATVRWILVSDWTFRAAVPGCSGWKPVT